MRKRYTNKHGQSIIATDYSYPSRGSFGQWEDSSDTYRLYESTNSEGVEKEFLDPKKAWRHAKS